MSWISDLQPLSPSKVPTRMSKCRTSWGFTPSKDRKPVWNSGVHQALNIAGRNIIAKIVLHHTYGMAAKPGSFSPKWWWTYSAMKRE